MKFTEKAKRFFTLNANHTEGFTLVELIVVIAILAILAGVAVPAYSGYINKANRAGDETLLRSVNEAFASACSKNGTDIYLQDSAVINLVPAEGSDGMKVDMDSVSPYTDDFALFFAGNENAQFKVITGLYFDPVLHMFVDAVAAGGATVALPGGGSVTLTPDQLSLLKNSTYAKDIRTLMGQVDNVSGLVYGLLDDGTGKASEIINAYTDTDEYKKNMITALGGTYDPNGDLDTQYASVLNKYVEDAAIQKIADKHGVSTEEVDIFDDKYSADWDQIRAELDTQVNKNMLIMSVAQNAATQSADDVMGIINSTNPAGLLASAMSGAQGADGMGQAALVYGAFTAYAMSDQGSAAAKAAIADTTNPTAVFEILTGEELTAFQTYMAGDQGQNDLNACIEAMGVIDNTSQDQAAVGGLMTNGFANDDFVGALNSLLGVSNS